MRSHMLGASGLQVSAIGLGCMGMSEFYGESDGAQSMAVIHRALDLGVTLVDTADIYGTGHNEYLVGEALRVNRGRLYRPRVVAVGLPDEVGLARLVSHEVRVD